MVCFISLCSQKSLSGRLNRVVRWLDRGFKHERSETDQTLEVRLALIIAWAGCIGCASDEELDVLAAFHRLIRCCEQRDNHGRIQEIHARALGCTACFLRWGRELGICDPLGLFKKKILVPYTHCSAIEEKMSLTAGNCIDEFIHAAAIGDSFALFNLGILCFCVNGDKRNEKKAIELWKQASDMGNTDAMVYLAACYDEGVPQDKKEAIGLIPAADMSNQKGLNSLVDSDDKRGVTKDKDKVIELYQQAASMGNTHAMTNLGFCYLKGDGVPQDSKKAIQLLQAAADTGHSVAMIYLSSCFLKGEGVPQDSKKAIELYQKASDMGNTNAMVKLGACYLKGEGVPQDKKKSIELFERAAEMGNTGAMLKLAFCYLKGDGVSQDKKKAFELYQRASESKPVPLFLPQ